MARQRIVEKRGANHTLHIVLTICTCGLWAITGWPIAAMMGRKTVTRMPAAPPSYGPPQQQPYSPQYGQPPQAQQWQQPAPPQQSYGQPGQAPQQQPWPYGQYGPPRP